MKYFKYKTLTEQKLSELFQRPRIDYEKIFAQVESIIKAVKKGGDKAVRDNSLKFDKALADPLIEVLQNMATFSIDKEIKKALDTAFTNIYQFHEAQLPETLEVETMPGVYCSRVARPIERVGLYIPGGSAILPSTLMMLGIPAMLSGCNRIIIATPPDEDGKIADELIYLAQKIGAEFIVKAGGAHAIAAMAYGTDTVPKVDKLFGPGNQYVTAAKMMLQNSEAQVAIDMPAGPSEVLVIADESADPEFVASDLLSQAEHGPDSQVVLIGVKEFNWKAFKKAMKQQLDKLPRKHLAQKALEHSFAIEVESKEQALTFSNRYAPEHLILQCSDSAELMPEVINAGSVFLGPWSPESAGDYASGTNHTLPTYGFARMYSGVSIDSFLKYITVQQLTPNGLQRIAPTVQALAELEQLEGHKQAVAVRLKKLRKSSS